MKRKKNTKGEALNSVVLIGISDCTVGWSFVRGSAVYDDVLLTIVQNVTQLQQQHKY